MFFISSLCVFAMSLSSCLKMLQRRRVVELLSFFFFFFFFYKNDNKYRPCGLLAARLAYTLRFSAGQEGSLFFFFFRWSAARMRLVWLPSKARTGSFPSLDDKRPRRYMWCPPLSSLRAAPFPSENGFRTSQCARTGYSASKRVVREDANISRSTSTRIKALNGFSSCHLKRIPFPYFVPIRHLALVVSRRRRIRKKKYIFHRPIN